MTNFCEIILRMCVCVCVCVVCACVCVCTCVCVCASLKKSLLKFQQIFSSISTLKAIASLSSNNTVATLVARWTC